MLKLLEIVLILLFIRNGTAITTKTFLKSGISRAKITQPGLVQDGETIVIMHKLTNKSLHSHSINYSSGTRQQEVTGYWGRDPNDYWTINHTNRDLVGTGFSNGDIVTIIHKQTNHSLHSHNARSPVTGQQEVTGYSGRDSNDNWKLESISGGTADNCEDGYLRVGSQFKLIHVNTNHALHSHGINLRTGSRQQEVTGYSGRDDNDWWVLDKIVA
jgi:dolichyl-phosphate-mannose--protein O-mannosyl transferase